MFPITCVYCDAVHCPRFDRWQRATVTRPRVMIAFDCMTLLVSRLNERACFLSLDRHLDSLTLLFCDFDAFVDAAQPGHTTTNEQHSITRQHRTFVCDLLTSFRPVQHRQSSRWIHQLRLHHHGNTQQYHFLQGASATTWLDTAHHCRRLSTRASRDPLAI